MTGVRGDKDQSRAVVMEEIEEEGEEAGRGTEASAQVEEQG